MKLIILLKNLNKWIAYKETRGMLKEQIKNEQIKKHGFDERRTKIIEEESVTEQNNEQNPNTQRGIVSNTNRPSEKKESKKVTQTAKYKIVFDNGKPFEVLVNTDIALEKAISDFYKENIDSEYQYDFTVYNEQDKDISESQFIQEMVNAIIETVGGEQ